MNRRVLWVGLALTVPLVAVLFANLGRDPRAIRSPLIGKAAPAFALPTADGAAAVELGELRGRVVVVNFWATWCVPCFEEHEVLARGAEQFADRAQFLGVVYQDEVARVERYLNRFGQSYPALLDEGGQTAIAYGVGGVPETYFISPEGVIVEKYEGPLTSRALGALVESAARHGDGS